MSERRGWLPPIGAVLGWTVATGLAVGMSTSLTWPDGSIAYIWLGNAPQLVALLLLPRRQWPVLLTAFVAVQAVLLVGDHGRSPLDSVIALAGNTIEVLLAAALLSPDRDWVEGRSDRLASWLWFALWGVVVAPAVGALIGITTFVTPDMPLPVIVDIVLGWYITDALALSVLVPLILRLRPRGLRLLRRPGELGRFAVVLAVLIAVTTVVFAADQFLLLFLVPIPLVVLLFRSGFAGLSVGMAAVTAISLTLTGDGRGPFQAVTAGDAQRALLPCQIFLITVFALMVVIAALFDERQRQAALQTASFEVYGLMATLSGDLVVVYEPGGWLLYSAPTASDLLGVADAALRGTGWTTLLHPDDRPAADRMIEDVARSGRTEGTFRMRHADGSWRWFAVQLRRSAGGAALDYLVVGLIRDVTDQRTLEDSLRSRADELSAIAHTDPLTGLANRRSLAEQRDQAWLTAARRQEPLTLLVVDIDRFKNFNDRYGHLAGDNCLTAVAAAISGALQRPGDTCGRYGGEEFVALLPDTDDAGARLVGEHVRAAVEGLALPHAASPLGVVTVSVGAATCQPPAGRPLEADRIRVGDELFRAADAALYRAKAAGRNTVVTTPFQLGPAAVGAAPSS